MMAHKRNTIVQTQVTRRFGFLKKIKRNHFIFFLCVLIAGLFWFMIKLSDVYRVTYVFRIEYNHVPVDKRLTSLIDSILTVDVTARGFALLDMGFGQQDVPLAIDLRNYQLISDRTDEYYIYTQELRKRLADKLNVDESNIILSENRLTFILEKLSQKKVPIVAKYLVNFKDQFGAYMKSRVTPDMIEVYGPASALDTLTRVFTNNISLNDVDSDIHVTLNLHNPAPNLLSFSVNSVLLEEDVERFTESSFVLPVNVGFNTPTIKTFPSSVKVFFKVALKDYSKIQPSQFNVTIDAEGVNMAKAKKLHLVLDRIPAKVSNVRVVPADVEFLILK